MNPLIVSFPFSIVVDEDEADNDEDEDEDDEGDCEDFLTVGTSPMSAILTRPWLSQHEKLILNLRGRFWHIGLRNKNLAIALAYGVASNASLGHTPAK